MAHKSNTLTQERLQELLHYDHESGEFRWINPSRKMRKDGPAGTITDQGRVAIQIGGKTYKAHRLAWLYCFGKFPNRQIDHIDGNPRNNAIANLRLASPSQNQANAKRFITNTTGYKGVSINKGKYRAMIRVDGVSLILGRFDCPVDAAKAYDRAALEHFGEYARGNFI